MHEPLNAFSCNILQTGSGLMHAFFFFKGSAEMCMDILSGKNQPRVDSVCSSGGFDLNRRGVGTNKTIEEGDRYLQPPVFSSTGCK